MTTKKDRIIALAKQGKPPRTIAAMVNTKVGNVYNAIRLARRSGHDIPVFRKASADAAAPTAETDPVVPGQIRITPQISKLLHGRADRLGLTPAETANRILEDALLTPKGQ